MKDRLIIIVTIISGYLFSVALCQTCFPETDCTINGLGAMVPDPINCERYYVCVLSDNKIVPSQSPLHCPEGQYFDFAGGTGMAGCIPENIPGICKSVCGLAKYEVCSMQCPLTPIDIVPIADDDSCSIFYYCTLTGDMLLNSCPNSEPYFNGVTCVNSTSQCCQCRPYCSLAGREVQDPCDCTSYYVCAGIGQPHELSRLNCTAGSYFDEITSTCVVGSCTSLCINCAD